VENLLFTTQQQVVVVETSMLVTTVILMAMDMVALVDLVDKPLVTLVALVEVALEVQPTAQATEFFLVAIQACTVVVEDPTLLAQQECVIFNTMDRDYEY
jgi:hypothetical protein